VHQEEVDLLLDRTKLEMQAAVQSGGPSPRALRGLISSSQQQLKGGGGVDSVQNVLLFVWEEGKEERAS
jgi:hypothetical protein